MKMKRNFMATLAVAIAMAGIPPVANGQLQLTVSDGTTTNSYAPVWGMWMDDSGGIRVQEIYKAEDLVLMTGAQITEMTFYSSSTSTSWASTTSSWKIGETTLSEFATPTTFIDGLTTVYETGEIINVGNGELTILFSQPYVYNGGNLVIDFSTTNKGSYSSASFYGVATNDYVSAYTRGGASSVSRQQFSPKVTFSYLPGDLPEYGVNVSPQSIEFPKTFTGRESSATVRVTNVGQNPLSITSIADQGAFKATYNEESIESLASADVTFTFAPTEAGVFEETLEIVFSNGDPVNVTVKGEAISSDIPAGYYQETFDGVSVEDLIPLYWQVSPSETGFSVYENEVGDKGLQYTAENPESIYWDEYGDEYFIISPMVSGRVMAFVRKTSTSSASVKFYNFSRDGNKFTRGDEITDVELSGELSNTEWTLASFNVTEQYVGVLLSRAAIDCFAAETLVPVTAITVDKPVSIPDRVTANAEGLATIPFSVTLTNMGTVDVMGSQYHYYIKDGDGVTLATFDGEDLLCGESKTVEGSFEYQIKDTEADSERFRVDVSEDLSNTSLYVTWITVYAYKAILQINAESGGQLSQPLDMGYFKGERSTAIALYNSGTAPLTVSAIEAVDGLVATLPEGTNLPVEIPAEESLRLQIDVVDPGSYVGECVTITHDGSGDTVLEMNAVRIPDDVFFEDFETGVFGDTWVVGDNWTISDRGGNYNPTMTSYNRLYATHGNLDDTTLLITPRLQVAEGEALRFTAYKRGANSTLSVYYSPDRNNWTRAEAISFDAQNSEEEKTVASIPEGEYYIGFMGGYIGIDNVFGYHEAAALPHDAMIVSFTGQKNTGMVNYVDTFTVITRNMLAEPDSYIVRLIDNGTIIDSVWVEEAAIDTLTFAYTPHEAGTHVMKAAIAAEDYMVESPGFTYEVEEEKLQNNVVVNDGEGIDINVPLQLNYKHTASQLLYTAEQLSGIAVGQKITSIAFPHNRYTSNVPHYDVKVWIGSTEATELTGNTISIEGLTLIYDGKLYIEQGKDDCALTFSLPTPMEYDGKGLCIVVAADSTSYGSTASFYTNNVGNNQVLRYAVDGSDLTQAPDRFATQSASLSQILPVLYVGLEIEPPYVSGYVYTSDQRVAVPDTRITFTRDNVMYSTTSDETGAYMLYVLQNGEYKVVIEKEGYLPCKVDETVIMEGTSIQRDFEIELVTGLETARKAQCKVYIVDGICHIEAAENILSLHVISMGGSMMTAKRPAASHDTIDMRYMPDGVYVVNVVTTSGRCAYKVVKH